MGLPAPDAASASSRRSRRRLSGIRHTVLPRECVSEDAFGGRKNRLQIAYAPESGPEDYIN